MSLLLSTNTKYPRDTSRFHFNTFDELLKKIKIIEGDSIAFRQRLACRDFDFVIVYGWGKMLPKQSKAMMEIGSDTKKKKERIIIISLNQDFSNEWMTRGEFDKMNVQ